MLIQFRVENHRSLRDEQVLSMVASPDVSQSRFVLETPALDEGLLPAVAIYGANASGKSNVLHAMAFACDAIIDSHRTWDPDGGVPVEPFVLTDREAFASTYEFQIIIGGVRYDYGFELTKQHVEKEWLYRWGEGPTAEPMFTRERLQFEFPDGVLVGSEAIVAFTRPNSLFLSVAAQNAHPVLFAIYRWFSRVDFRADENRRRGRMVPRRLRRSRRAGGWPPPPSVREMLRAADVGILDFRVVDSPDHVTGIEVLHEGAPEGHGWLPLDWESSGTRTLLNIARRVTSPLQLGGAVVIDEIERDLHPAVAMEIVRMFADAEINRGGGQLIFSTHDTNLLGRTFARSAPLARDQIWFTEKDRTGASQLYPLTDFHDTGEEDLERGYLQGRYGAVPYLGALADVFRESARPAGGRRDGDTGEER